MRANIKLKFIDENIAKIKKADRVNIIRPVSAGDDWAVWAKLNNGDAIRLTLPMEENLWLPKEPLLKLADIMGQDYWRDFGIIEKSIAINKKHIRRLAYARAKRYQVNAYAYFDDGECVSLGCISKRYFLSKFKVQAEQELGVEFEDISKQAFIDEGLKR